MHASTNLVCSFANLFVSLDSIIHLPTIIMTRTAAHFHYHS
jgi:hypothetical protein